MNAEQNNTHTNTLDILALLDEEQGVTKEVLIDVLPQTESPSVDILTHIASDETPRESLLTRLRRASAPKVQFAFYYLSISAIVFVILLATTNWNSYSTVLITYLNPQALTNSRNDIISVLDKSRVIVYASDTADTSATTEEQTDLKKKLEANHTSIQEDRFSPKRLIP